MTTRTIDSRGRLNLGKPFANRLVIIRELPGGLLQIVPAEAVPAREAWLYKNPAAITSVMRGLEQSKEAIFAEAPDLEGDSALADLIGND